jgi:hypothetical protein
MLEKFLGLTKEGLAKATDTKRTRKAINTP